MVFDEAVAVAVAIGVDPGQGRLCIRPQLPHGVEVGGARKIFAEQQHEKGSRIHAAVVAPEWHLPQIGHFSVAHLVQNFSRLRVALRFDGGGLRRCEKSQHALRNTGIGPQGHERRNDAVAAEGRAEPGRAGVGIGPFRGFGDQHVQVGHRTPRDLVEHRVGAVDARRPRARFAQPVTRGPHAPVEYAPTPTAGIRVRNPDANEDPPHLPRIQRRLEPGALGRQRLWRRIEIQSRYALDLIEARIVQCRPAIAVASHRQVAARPAAFAAHFEQVGEVGAELQRNAYAPHPVAEVAYQKPLVASSVPDELEPMQVDLLVPQGDLSIEQEIRIAEIGGEHGVVVLCHRAQQQRPRFFEQQFQVRQDAGIAVI